MSRSWYVCIASPQGLNLSFAAIHLQLTKSGIELSHMPAQYMLADPRIHDRCVGAVLILGNNSQSAHNIIRDFRDNGLKFPIGVVQEEADASQTIHAFAAGAVAFSTSNTIDQLFTNTFCNAVMNEFNQLSFELGVAQRFDKLSPRERQVLVHLVQGKSIKSIARETDISISTAEKHRANILSKSGFDTTLELVRFIIGDPETPSFLLCNPETSMKKCYSRTSSDLRTKRILRRTASLTV